ncbi:guanitoxin biosynthesis heme-dependent pre-guanitoxin N-hydroxylase GntA [Altericroceibacterium xinjiangense]|uniref:guanitoxin biosynthesis heme-dependent pre-guanitoxin N-hydroxylase GntA n=1 Tax=Altericroceibacterium xinjiangense TaxID=762261 RepID=UPI000F7F3BB1|nr:guanitoxin biosynthesis heme-dependent pre-guanitoxin N-hydroxylase GntA [Altericroceibacterium xinjiangense]
MLVDDKTEQLARAELFDKIADHDFPCVGAKSAVARGTLKVLVCHSLTSGWDDVRIHGELLEWAKAYRQDPGGLRSLAAVFEGPGDLDETEFERAMWERIQSCADKDSWRGQPYDERVSSNPEDPHFSLSFGGEAFFVVGLHPQASRPARRFPRPTLVFNLHDQFERLREEGRYERMREKILERDQQLAGHVNPMLTRFGEVSEARQYSGRLVDDEWKCPFHDPRIDTDR